MQRIVRGEFKRVHFLVGFSSAGVPRSIHSLGSILLMKATYLFLALILALSPPSSLTQESNVNIEISITGRITCLSVLVSVLESIPWFIFADTLTHRVLEGVLTTQLED